MDSSDLYDKEQAMFKNIEAHFTAKYLYKSNSIDNLGEFSKDILDTLKKCGFEGYVDGAPCFYGMPPAVVVTKRIEGSEEDEYGFDHERKRWEVLKSVERGEQFLGQKEKY